MQNGDLTNYQNKYLSKNIIGYINSNFAKNSKNCKLVIKYCFFIKKLVTNQCNTLQKTISILISKIKYVVISKKAKKIMWIQQFINKLLPNKAVRKMNMQENNKTSFILVRGPKS